MGVIMLARCGGNAIIARNARAKIGNTVIFFPFDVFIAIFFVLAANSV
jgi:hypothetical protein